jgi:hypothetical protein
MAKFKVKMKLQGFELEIEGERQDAALISEHIGSQLTSIMKPIAGIVEGEVESTAPSVQVLETNTDTRPRKKKKSGGGTPERRSSSAAIDFVLKDNSYGTPKQAWSNADKAMWLIFVLRELGNGDQFSGSQLNATFNKHFKQAGTMQTGNINTQLGKKKTEAPPRVGEDTTKEPSEWFLTEQGIADVRALIVDNRSELL